MYKCICGEETGHSNGVCDECRQVKEEQIAEHSDEEDEK